MADGKIIFIGKAGAYAFDGQNFERIDYGVFISILKNIGSVVPLGQDYKEAKMIWDPITRNVFLFMLGPGEAAGSRLNPANVFYSYNTISKRWGYQSRLSEDATGTRSAVFDISALNDYVTTATIGVGDGTGGPLYSTNVGFYSFTADRVTALSTNFSAALLPGTNYKPNIRSYRFGVRDKMTALTRFIPNWTLEDGAGSDLSAATVKTATFYTSDSVMEGSVAMATVNLSTDQNRADTLQTARWHNVELKVNAPAVIDGGMFVGTTAGTD
jgi:hypothetical protein